MGALGNVNVYKAVYSWPGHHGHKKPEILRLRSSPPPKQERDAGFFLFLKKSFNGVITYGKHTHLKCAARFFHMRPCTHHPDLEIVHFPPQKFPFCLFPVSTPSKDDCFLDFGPHSLVLPLF